MPDLPTSRARHRYLIYGLVVESELALTSVEKCASDDPVAIHLTFASNEWFRERAPHVPQDSGDWVRHAVLPDGSVFVRAHEVFEAIVSADGRRVICAALADDDDRAVEAHLVTFALSAALTLQGEECLHATVVEREGRGIGLIGSSGAGKSTLAAFLIGRTGASLVTDDMLRLRFAEEGVLAFPGPGRLKLFEDNARTVLPNATHDGGFSLNRFSGKLMFQSPRAVGRDPVPLATLFWLGDPAPLHEGEVGVRPLVGMEKAKVLLSSAMDIRYVETERLARQMRFVERLARRLPVLALAYERRHALLPGVVNRIERAIAA